MSLGAAHDHKFKKKLGEVPVPVTTFADMFGIMFAVPLF